MVIESRKIVGTGAAFAVVGAALWLSVSMLRPAPTAHNGTVEIQQIEERSWAVEVKDLGAMNVSSEIVKTAANR